MRRRAGNGWGLLASAVALVATAIGASTASASTVTPISTGTLVANNCAPVAAANDGTMVWWIRNSSGVDDAYVGNGNCQGTPLLPPYSGHRGPSDMTKDGRYVLLTTAVGWDKSTEGAAPGKGSQNAIQLYDRQTGRLSTLLPGAQPTQRGVIWPRFNSDGTKIVWAQMVRTPWEVNFPWGDWELHVADVNLSTGTLSNNRKWRDPLGTGYEMIEAYGWIPGTNRLIFQSTAEATTTNAFKAAQLYTLPDSFTSTTAPTRISPPMAPFFSWQQWQDQFHEFANFTPGDPYTLYTSIVNDTLGGDDLYAYDLRTQGSNGLLGQPKRISYFGGDPNNGYYSQAVPGWPTPRYEVVTMMAWVNGAWVAAACPDMYCTQTDAYRITIPAGGPFATTRSVSGAHRRHAARRHRHHRSRRHHHSARHGLSRPRDR